MLPGMGPLQLSFYHIGGFEEPFLKEHTKNWRYTSRVIQWYSIKVVLCKHVAGTSHVVWPNPCSTCGCGDLIW